MSFDRLSSGTPRQSPPHNRRNARKDNLKWIIPAAVVIILIAAVGLTFLLKPKAPSTSKKSISYGGRSSSSSSSSSSSGRRVETKYDYDIIDDDSGNSSEEDTNYHDDNSTFSLVLTVPENVGTCTNSACTKTVQEIISLMETPVDPCDNFYEFACQKWQQENPRPPRIGEWDVFSKLQNETYTIVRDILEKPIRKTKSGSIPADLPAFQQAKQFYRKCKNADEVNDKVALKPMWDTLEKYGGWPILYHGRWDPRFGVGKKFDWMRSLVDVKKYFGNAVILEIMSYQSFDGDLDENTIIIKPDGGFTGKKNLIDSSGDKEVDHAVKTILAYKDLIVNIAKELLVYKGERFINETYLESTAFQVIFVQREIGKLQREAVDPMFLKMYGINATSGEVTLDRLQGMLNNYVGRVENELQLPRLLSLMYSDTPVYIARNEKVLVTDFHFLLKLAKFLSIVNPEALANYIHFNMAVEMAFKTTRKMRTFGNKLHSVVHGTVEQEPPRSMACVEQIKTQFHHVVGQAYVKTRFPQPMDSLFDQIETQLMFNNVKKTLIDLVSASNRISFVYKHVLMLKIHYTTLCYGHPTWIYNDKKVQAYYSGLKIDQASYLEQYMAVNAWSTNKELSLLREAFDTKNECTWDLFAGTVGAANHLTKFVVYLPMGILQPPFFDLDYPKVLNYGRLGTILGHELVHSLDGLGWTRYEGGSLTNTAECFVRQFDNFTTEELKDQSSVTVNGRLTLHENIPDSAGLFTAFTAFKRLSVISASSSTQVADSDKPIKGLEKYTNDQLFFLGFAQNFCESSTMENMIKSMTSGKHSPGMFRILGTLKNSKEFSQAWNCPVGSKMNPTVQEYERCPVF